MAPVLATIQGGLCLALLLAGACGGAAAAGPDPATITAASAAPAPPPPPPPVSHPFASTAAETTRLIDVAIDDRAVALMACVDAARPRRRNPHDRIQLEVALDQEGHLLGVKTPATTAPDATLAQCAQAALDGASFPRSHAGVITVTKSFQEQAFHR